MYTGNSKKLGKLIKNNGFDYAMFVTEYNGAFYHELHYQDEIKDHEKKPVFAKVTDTDAVLVTDQKLINTILDKSKTDIPDNMFNPKKVFAVMIELCPKDKELLLNKDGYLLTRVFEAEGFEPRCTYAEDDIAEEILDELRINYKLPKRIFPGWQTVNLGEGDFLVVRENLADKLLGKILEKEPKKRKNKCEKILLEKMSSYLADKTWSEKFENKASQNKDSSKEDFAEKLRNACKDVDNVAVVFVGGMFKRPCGMVLEILTKVNNSFGIVEFEGDSECFSYLEKIGINLEEDDFFKGWNYLSIDEEDFALFNRRHQLNMNEALALAKEIQKALTEEELYSWCEEQGIEWQEPRNGEDKETCVLNTIAYYLAKYSG